MRHLFILTAFVGAMYVGSVGAAAPAQPASPDAKVKTSQQNKMATCNKDATGMKGDARKAFMKKCLSAKKPDMPKAK